jgi:condensin complex subunit 3
MDAFNDDEMNALLGDPKDDDDDDEQEGGHNRKDEIEEERLDKEFVISEMLRLAVNLDYSDEIGRRKMRQLVRKCNIHGLD